MIPPRQVEPMDYTPPETKTKDDEVTMEVILLPSIFEVSLLYLFLSSMFHQAPLLH